MCCVAHVYLNKICFNAYKKPKTHWGPKFYTKEQSDDFAKFHLIYIIFSKTHYKGGSERINGNNYI